MDAPQQVSTCFQTLAKSATNSISNWPVVKCENCHLPSLHGKLRAVQKSFWVSQQVSEMVVARVVASFVYRLRRSLFVYAR